MQCLLVLDKENVKLPVTLLPTKPGQYPCTITLQAPNDIRVYHIECTVKLPDSVTELQFTCATHSNVVQHVPVVSATLLNSYVVDDICWTHQPLSLLL